MNSVIELFWPCQLKLVEQPHQCVIVRKIISRQVFLNVLDEIRIILGHDRSDGRLLIRVGSQRIFGYKIFADKADFGEGNVFPRWKVFSADDALARLENPFIIKITKHVIS
jgi:hypothetical protein